MGSLALFETSPQAMLSLDDGLRALPGLACALDLELRGRIQAIERQAPFRHMRMPGGRRIAAAQTSCGSWGWVSDGAGYRYSPVDPLSGLPWPAMPASFLQLASEAAARAGLPGFHPDSCLINRYEGAAGMGLHQDRDEPDLAQPIVSVSLGRSTDFLWGGHHRSDRPRSFRLQHGDILVWFGPDRLRFHGVKAPYGPAHPQWGDYRINLTFRRAMPDA